MGYPASYRQRARPSHGFQGGGGKSSGSPSGEIIPFPKKPPPKWGGGGHYDHNPQSGWGAGQYPQGDEIPYRPPVKAPKTFGPPTKFKRPPFGRKVPKNPLKFFKPGWWDVGEFVWNEITNPQPVSFAWNVPPGGWELVNTCSPNQNTYNSEAWAMTTVRFVDILSSACFGLQAFTYGGDAGNYPGNDPAYEPASNQQELIIWDQHRTLPTRWANRFVYNRALGSVVTPPHYGPNVYDLPQYKPSPHPRRQPAPGGGPGQPAPSPGGPRRRSAGGRSCGGRGSPARGAPGR